MLNLIEVDRPQAHTIDVVRRFALLILLVVSACSVGRPADDAAGDEIYRRLCASCHDIDLSGGIGRSLGPGSDAAGRSDEFLEFTIMRGRGSMPSFSSSLNEEQLARLVVYIREIQAG